MMFGWLHSKLPEKPADKSPGEQKFDIAMQEADDFLQKTRSVRQQIEPYVHADDPFEAIQRATAADGFYR